MAKPHDAIEDVKEINIDSLLGLTRRSDIAEFDYREVYVACTPVLGLRLLREFENINLKYAFPARQLLAFFVGDNRHIPSMLIGVASTICFTQRLLNTRKIEFENSPWTAPDVLAEWKKGTWMFESGTVQEAFGLIGDNKRNFSLSSSRVSMHGNDICTERPNAFSDAPATVAANFEYMTAVHSTASLLPEGVAFDIDVDAENKKKYEGTMRHIYEIFKKNIPVAVDRGGAGDCFYRSLAHQLEREGFFSDKNSILKGFGSDIWGINDADRYRQTKDSMGDYASYIDAKRGLLLRHLVFLGYLEELLFSSSTRLDECVYDSSGNWNADETILIKHVMDFVRKFTGEKNNVVIDEKADREIIGPIMTNVRRMLIGCARCPRPNTEKTKENIINWWKSAANIKDIHQLALFGSRDLFSQFVVFYEGDIQSVQSNEFYRLAMKKTVTTIFSSIRAYLIANPTVPKFRGVDFKNSVDEYCNVFESQLNLEKLKPLGDAVLSIRESLMMMISKTVNMFEWVEASQFAVIARKLHVNIIIYERKMLDNRDVVNDPSPRHFTTPPNAEFTCCVMSIGYETEKTVKSTHFVSGKLIPEVLSSIPRAHSSLLLNFDQFLSAGTDTQENDYLASTYQYTKYTKNMTAMLYVFYKISASTGLLRQIRFAIEMIDNFRKGGKRTFNVENSATPSGNIIRLPSALGFGKGRDSLFSVTAYNAMDMGPKYAEKHVKIIQTFIDNVEKQTKYAMYTAAAAIVLFMMTPPFDIAPEDTAINFEDTRSLGDMLHIVCGTRETDSLMNLQVKSWMRAPHASNARELSELTKIVSYGFVVWPKLFKYTAFFDFFSTCIGNIASAIQEPIYVRLSTTPSNAPLHIATTAAIFQQPQGGSGDKVIELDIKVEEAASPRGIGLDLFEDILADSNVEVVAWLTRLPESIELSTYEDTGKPLKTAGRERLLQFESEKLSMSHFLDGNRVAWACVDLKKTGAVATITMHFKRFELEALAKMKDKCFLHLAVMVRETSDTPGVAPRISRRGHSFVDILEIEPNIPFRVGMWEGPIDSTMTLRTSPQGRMGFSKTFEYERTFVLDVTVRDPMNVFVKGAPIDPVTNFNIDTPNRLFSELEMEHMANYMHEISSSRSRREMAMHSFIYVNMPMHLNVAPLWTVSYLPPIDVHENVLESRAALILLHENIDEKQFLQIAYVGFKGVLFDAADAREWGFGDDYFKGSEPFACYARERFIWIFSQIVNPYNKLRYCFDKFNRLDNEQMGMPSEDSGDCEDFAEAAMRFCRALNAKFDPDRFKTSNRVVYIVLRFLRLYSPCMSVMTTDGAALRTEKQNNAEMGLHMLAILVLKSKIDTSLKPESPVYPRVIPLEGTGLQFNIYRTVDSCFSLTSDGALKMQIEDVKHAVERYNDIVDIAYANSPDVKNEVVVFPMMINRESARKKGPGSGYTAWSFIKPRHHFYDNFVSLCHDEESNPNKFLDFYSTNGGQRKLSVPFYTTVIPPVEKEPGDWILVPVALVKKTTEGLYDMCRKLAANVMPASSLIHDNVLLRCDDEADRKREEKTTGNNRGESDTFVDALMVKAVNFYINTKSRPNGRQIMEKLKTLLEEKTRGMAGVRVRGIDTVFTINMNTAYLLIQVLISKEKKFF